MKNWMFHSLLIASLSLAALSAKAQMSVEMRDATPEDQLALDSEMDATFGEVDHNEQKRNAKADAARKAREQAALLAGARAERQREQQQARAAQAAQDQQVQSRTVRRRIVTQTWVAQNDQAPVQQQYTQPRQAQPYQQNQYAPNQQPVQQNQYAPNGRAVRRTQPVSPLQDQPTYYQRELERQWLPRRTGITIIPTLIVGDSITSSDYISSTATGGSLSHASKFNFGGGVMAEFGRSMFTLETGLLYFQESVDASYGFNTTYYSTYGQTTSLNDDATLGYLGIPVIGKVNFSPSSQKMRFNVSGGLIPAFLMNSSLDYKQNTAYSTNEITDPNSVLLNMGGFRTFNVFGTVGVGGDFTVGEQKDVRAELSWRRALMSETSNSTTTVDSFLLSLGFGFDI